MTIQYQIFEIVSKTVHIPSGDYYAKRGESQEDDITLIQQTFGSYDTFEEAESAIEGISIKGEYAILKTYKL